MPTKEQLWNPVLPGQVWVHNRKGTRYFITGIKQPNNDYDDDNNPPTVLYMDGQGGDYARDINKWHGSFTLEGTL